jgi:DNA-3-methyladenine glycosylase II
MDFEGAKRKAEAALKANDQKLAVIIDKVGQCTISPHTNYYQELVESIISQQLSIRAAATITQRFRSLSKSEFPAPKQIINFSFDELRAVGLSGAKVKYIQDLAHHVIDGRLDVRRLPELTNDEIIVELTDVKGIGEWTAHMFLIFSLGRLDVLPVGDLGIRRGIQILYELDELPGPEQIRQIATKNGWTGYESVASWYIWKVVDVN